MIRLFGLALVFISFAFVSIGQDQKKSRLASILSITGNDSTSFSFEQGVTHLTFVFQGMSAYHDATPGRTQDTIIRLCGHGSWWLACPGGRGAWWRSVPGTRHVTVPAAGAQL